MAKIYTSAGQNKFVDKFFLSYYDEEEWLNSMAHQGFHLFKKTFFRYYFTYATYRDVKYSVEILDHPADNPLSKEYVEEKKKSGLELAAQYKNRAYFRMSSENYSRTGAEKAKRSRRKSVAYMFASFFIAFLACALMLCYHCVSSLNFRVERSAETMSSLTQKMPVFGIFEKIAKLIRLDRILGDYQSTSVVVMFFIAVVALSIPVAIYFRELVITRKTKGAVAKKAALKKGNESVGKASLRKRK